MADDKLPCCRSPSIVATNSESVTFRSPAIAFKLPQNPSSRLTLVLCPPMTTERFKTADFILLPSFSFNESDSREPCRNIWAPFLLRPGRKGHRPPLHSTSIPADAFAIDRARTRRPAVSQVTLSATYDQLSPGL